MVARTQEADIKQALMGATQAAVDRVLFGSALIPSKPRL